eukprot:scaffold239573_cov28-Tisochrysis_lutea.AAC.4
MPARIAPLPTQSARGPERARRAAGPTARLSCQWRPSPTLEGLCPSPLALVQTTVGAFGVFDSKLC